MFDSRDLTGQPLINCSIIPSDQPSTQSVKKRVYICADVDSFFAQCDSRKLGIDNSVPLISVQWRLCVSVNYAARAYGIKNLMLLDDAIKLCPHVFISHADTFKPGESITNPYDTKASEKLKVHEKNKEKVSLEHYRAEADKIFNVLEKYSNIVEKASFDEAFLDVTEEAMEIYKRGDYSQEWAGKMCGGEKFKPETEHEALMMIASQISQKIIVEIEQTLNYTCSAGIAFNKMLSKLASGLNKPNGQAIICERYVLEALKPIKIEKLRNFGRKITGTFEEAGYHTLGDIHNLNLQQISDIVLDKKTAKWVYFRARGFDSETVESKEFASKSIMSSKSLRNVDNLNDLELVLDLILTELNVRLQKWFEAHKTVPRTINLHFRGAQKEKIRRNRIKSTGIDLKLKKEEFPRVLKEKSMELIQTVGESLFPCNYLAVSIKNFEKSDFHKFEFDMVSYLNKNRDAKMTNLETQDDLIIPIREEVDMGDMGNTMTPQNTASCEKLLEIEEEKIECMKCLMLILKSEYESHMDFHTAEELDRELNPNKKKYKSKQKLSPNEKEVNSKAKPIKNEAEIDNVLKKVKRSNTPIKSNEKAKQSPTLTLDKFFMKK